MSMGDAKFPSYPRDYSAEVNTAGWVRFNVNGVQGT